MHRAFGLARRLGCFGPLPGIPTGFTRFDLREGQHKLMVLPRNIHETYVLLTTPSVRAFISGNVPMITMPSADFCAAINRPYERLSPDAPETTQISRGKFDRLRRTPAESTETELDGYGLRGRRPARPPETASYPVLVHRATTVAPRFLQTPPRGGSPCASFALHLHQVVQGTCTPRLSNMLGTPTIEQAFSLRFRADLNLCEGFRGISPKEPEDHSKLGHVF